ncbi:MAG: hypothetical protein IKC08_06080, partial [Lentisphaeria bacterium]|nr:hypothetical protein [Lentisphaeria bacterium]
PMTGINFVPVDTKIRQGTMVRTSFLTGNAPGGLPVGKIAAIKPRQAGVAKDHVYQQTALLPYADPGKLYFAAIYVKAPPAKHISPNRPKHLPAYRKNNTAKQKNKRSY